MIKEQLKILIVEDLLSDYQLIEYQIKKIVENPFFIHAMNFEEFQNSLKNTTPDIIISDYNLPGYNGMYVLNYAQKHYPKTTFIFITGTIDDEELAANTILSGASGYILKKNIANLSSKLLPLFEQTVKNTNTIDTNILEIMDNYLEKARSDNNQLTQEGYKQIKKSIELIKKTNNRLKS